MKRLTALLFGLTCVLVFVLGGCSNDDTFTKKSFSSGENIIERIEIQVENRELEISAAEDNQISIDYFDGEKEYLEITVSKSKELTIKLLYNKNWTDYIGTKPSKEYGKILIKIPYNLIAVLNVKTTNENIKVTSLSFTENLSLNADGGDIECEQINAGKSIDLTAKNGNITGSIIGGWDDYSISCTIKKGNCNLPTSKEDGDKSFSANCNNGDINIKFVKQ